MQLAVKAIDDAVQYRDYYTKELLDILKSDLFLFENTVIPTMVAY